MSVRQSLGKVAVVPKGSWDGTKTYEFLDIVKSGGGSYIARQDVPIGIAITNTEYWVSLVDKGDPGDSAIVPAYIDTDVIRYLNDHGTHATDDIYTSLLMREDVDSGVLPFIVRPTGSDSTTEEYFELDHQIHSADSPVIHFRSREHLLAVDSTGHFTLTDRPQAVTEQTVSGWGFTKNAVRYDEQMALTDTQKATARTNIGAVGELEYDALESDIESLEAGLSLKLDAADAPTKVSDLQNDTGFVTAQQAAAAAPLQSVNGRTGAVVLSASDVHALPDTTVIPSAVTEQTVSGWGFTKNTGNYSKPSGGIPKTDLAADVQASLGKANTALQQHQSLTGYATETWVTGQGYQTAQDVQTAIEAAAELPTVTASDNGKFLRVVSGAWEAATIPAAESNSF